MLGGKSCKVERIQAFRRLFVILAKKASNATQLRICLGIQISRRHGWPQPAATTDPPQMDRLAVWAELSPTAPAINFLSVYSNTWGSTQTRRG
jgi:hypothetical protein